ncbi:hypothetical protein ACFPRL_03735 [Pseudoclavibacter helvolus]
MAMESRIHSSRVSGLGAGSRASRSCRTNWSIVMSMSVTPFVEDDASGGVDAGASLGGW